MTSKKNTRHSLSDQLDYAGRSEIGRVKAVNEDRFVIAAGENIPGHIGATSMMFAVADGIGGNNAGDVASRMACEKLLSRYRRSLVSADQTHARQEIKEKTASILFQIDREIRRESHGDKTLEDMGTTLTAMFLWERFAVVAHVGDSRIYRLRDGCLAPITSDHSFVQEMIEEGEITAEDVPTHPLRHMLTSCLGTEEPLETFYVDTVTMKPGDRFLLCTDGLSNMVCDETIATVLKATDDPREMVNKLVGKAIENGGKDNVTVIVVHIRSS